MSDCCSSNTDLAQHPKRYVCPKNGKQYHEVPYSTVLHHVKSPWLFTPRRQAYYFCEDAACDVVYFGHDDTVLCKDQLRTKVGIKESSEDVLICYCFGVSKFDAKHNPATKTFVIEQTKQSNCACTTFNPSGRCCLKDFSS